MDIIKDKLKFKDGIILGFYLGSHSMREIDVYYQQGRVTEKDYEIMSFVWEWSGFRYSSTAQERYYNKHGKEKFYQKIDQCNRVFKKYMEKRLKYCIGQ